MIPLKDDNPTARFPWVTVLLIVANVSVWLFVQGAGQSPVAEQNKFVFEYAAIPCEVVTGEPLTIDEVETDTCISEAEPRSRQLFPDKGVYLAILISMFLHASWLHIGGNMLFLWIFGNNVEDKFGPLPYLGVYLAGGFVATLAQTMLDTGSVVPLVGASGAVAVAMGAYLVLFPRARVLTLFLVIVARVPAWLVLALWFALQFLTDEGSGVAWMAHVGGFVFGVVVALFVRPTQWWRGRQQQSAQYF
ncbi:MAG: rhomboid family intramembrane serine protease [Acidimicrobiia bacterium]